MWMKNKIPLKLKESIEDDDNSRLRTYDQKLIIMRGRIWIDLGDGCMFYLLDGLELNLKLSRLINLSPITHLIS